MDRRRSLAALLALGLVPARLAAQRRMPRIGYLSLPPITELPSRERQAFLDGLGEFGLVPGKSIEIIYRSAENEPDFLRPMCEELLREGVVLLATPGAFPTLAALSATRSVPIVFLALGDPVGSGVTTSLARPDRNATGSTFVSSELAGKRLEFLKRAVPGARRVALLWERNNRNAQSEAMAAQTAAGVLGLVAESLPVDTQAGLNAALRRIAADRPDAIYVSFAAGVISNNRSTIAEFGLLHRLPVVSGWAFMTEAGGLLSYAPDVPAMFRRSAYYVYRILNGAKPEDLPIERATKFELVLNKATARSLKLELPPDLTLQANRVIE